MTMLGGSPLLCRSSPFSSSMLRLQAPFHVWRRPEIHEAGVSRASRRRVLKSERDKASLTAELKAAVSEEVDLLEETNGAQTAPLEGSRSTIRTRRGGESTRETWRAVSQDREAQVRQSKDRPRAFSDWSSWDRLPAALDSEPTRGSKERLKINLDLNLYWGKQYQKKGRQDLAETIFRRCIKDWPDEGRPYVALGKLLQKLGKVGEARKVYEVGCQATRGENAFLWQAWAVLEDRDGNKTIARRLFDASIVADKRHAAAWHGWSMLELREGNISKARSLLNKGVQLCAASEYLYQSLALLEVKMGRSEQARKYFDQATRTNPKSVASWLAWAMMESEEGTPERARTLFEMGVQASPKNRYVWLAWGLFEAREGDMKKGREFLQQGHTLNPRDPALLQALALLEYECGQPNTARDLFKKAASVDSYHQPVWIAWGWMEWKEGNIERARELYQRAVSVDSKSPRSARVFHAWGVLEDREGNVAIARELFKCALRVDPECSVAWLSWANMEDRQGNAVRADKLRSLCLQQRTEVVDSGNWDLSLSEMVNPAIDVLKSSLSRFNEQLPWTKPRAAAARGGVGGTTSNGKAYGGRPNTSASWRGGEQQQQREDEADGGFQNYEEEMARELNLPFRVPVAASNRNGVRRERGEDGSDVHIDKLLEEFFPWKFGKGALAGGGGYDEDGDRGFAAYGVSAKVIVDGRVQRTSARDDRGWN